MCCSEEAAGWPGLDLECGAPAWPLLAQGTPAGSFPAPAGRPLTCCTCAPTWPSTTSPHPSSTLKKPWWWREVGCRPSLLAALVGLLHVLLGRVLNSCCEGAMRPVECLPTLAALAAAHPPLQCRMLPAEPPGSPPSTLSPPSLSWACSCWPRVREGSPGCWALGGIQSPSPAAHAHKAMLLCCMDAPRLLPPRLLLILHPAGRVLRSLGLPVALSVLPSSAGLLMAGIALWPAPASGTRGRLLRPACPDARCTRCCCPRTLNLVLAQVLRD